MYVYLVALLGHCGFIDIESSRPRKTAAVSKMICKVYVSSRLLYIYSFTIDVYLYMVKLEIE